MTYLDFDKLAAMDGKALKYASARLQIDQTFVVQAVAANVPPSEQSSIPSEILD